MKKYFFKVSDYIQIACSGKHTVRLVLNSNGEKTGEIVIADGILWDASDSKGTGEKAFTRLAFRKDIQVDLYQVEDSDIKRTIFQQCDELLIKEAAERDKKKQGKEKNGLLSEKRDDLRSVINEGLESILKRDYKSAVDIFTELNVRYPGNLTIKSKLEELKKMGPRKS